MPDETLVWVSTLRSGIAHHAVDFGALDRDDPKSRTRCGRFVGNRDLGRGVVVTLAEAQQLGSPECVRCYQPIPRHTYPVIRPTREKLR